ncbi:hypothetical protein FB45DRAFT_1007585 [Roridomyces roridus]|uniref:C2H2-type domain-containing protein n=1 Tax=Roridomyces roridus TaxID=1738132 RepID=A0AAD7BD92_9AGAR|nr:hypothetical protein FB45DRAFT_1007585 [Roridomyces roridus]
MARKKVRREFRIIQDRFVRFITPAEPPPQPPRRYRCLFEGCLWSYEKLPQLEAHARIHLSDDEIAERMLICRKYEACTFATLTHESLANHRKKCNAGTANGLRSRLLILTGNPGPYTYDDTQEDLGPTRDDDSQGQTQLAEEIAVEPVKSALTTFSATGDVSKESQRFEYVSGSTPPVRPIKPAKGKVKATSDGQGSNDPTVVMYSWPQPSRPTSVNGYANRLDEATLDQSRVVDLAAPEPEPRLNFASFSVPPTPPLMITHPHGFSLEDGVYELTIDMPSPLFPAYPSLPQVHEFARERIPKATLPVWNPPAYHVQQPQTPISLSHCPPE